MKKFTITFILSLLMFSLFSQTYFEGGIYNNTVWTVDDGPYIITGDVVLFPDKTLTIEPGVEIRFDGDFFLEIRGELISVGTQDQRILYTSNLSNPAKGDWKGVWVKTTQGAKAGFEYSDFYFADKAARVYCCNDGGPVYFKSCKFHDNTNALYGYTGYNNAVDSCEFINNTYAVRNADKDITNSVFIGNEYGLYETERVSVRKSIFQENDNALYGGRELVDSCLIENNDIGIQPFFEGFESFMFPLSNASIIFFSPLSYFILILLFFKINLGCLSTGYYCF